MFKIDNEDETRTSIGSEFQKVAPLYEMLVLHIDKS